MDIQLGFSLHMCKVTHSVEHSRSLDKKVFACLVILEPGLETMCRVAFLEL